MKKFDDQIRFLLPTFVVLLWSSMAFAALDLRLGGTSRSYPLSGVVEAASGYGIPLYGQAGAPFSGYLRPAIEGATAVTYNSGLAQLEFYPLAFLGVRVGGESIQNDRDYTAYDCEGVLRCKGRFHRTFFGSEISLGAGPVFVHGRWRRDRWSQTKNQAGDFIEPTSGLIMQSKGESQTVYYGLGGYKISDIWSVIGGVRYAQDDEGFSRMPFGMVRYLRGDISLGVGVGEFESSLKRKQFTAWGYLSWDIWPNPLAVK